MGNKKSMQPKKLHAPERKIPSSDHICKPFYCFGKAGNGLVGVTVLDTVPDTVVDMSFQNNLPHFMQSGLSGIDLRQNILTGNVFIHHTVNGLNLTDDLFQSSVEIFRIHTLSHATGLLFRSL
jgi:hypothetical protein